jgi:hypothetical protein
MNRYSQENGARPQGSTFLRTTGVILTPLLSDPSGRGEEPGALFALDGFSVQGNSCLCWVVPCTEHSC